MEKSLVSAPFNKINAESVQFLIDHDFLPNVNFYNNLVELQYMLDGILEFISYNSKQIKNSKGDIVDEEYDSMFFSIVEHHVKNAIYICG